MKIFFTIKSLNTTAGTERATTVVANALAERGYEIGIVVFVNEGKPFFELHPTIKLIYLYHKKDKRASLIRDFSRRKRLRKIYNLEKPDIVIFVGSGRSMLNIPSAKNIKTITWEHFNANINWHLFHPFSKRLASKYCDRIVTLTNKDRELYYQKYRAKNTVCIPNPITIDSSVKSALTDKVVLSIGRLTEQKGYDMLIHAWNKVKNRNNGWKLRIVGDGQMKSLLLNKINLYGLQNSVEIIPPTSDIITQYKNASIYVMSSRYEGLPLVLIEAMAMGLPIVSFNCETGPSEIIINGETGILVPPANIDKLAAELDNLINDENKRHFFSENSIKRAELFTIDKVIDKWEALFSELKDRT
ncbi:MAG: glycosyltransferase family 4 protein [Paludibacteraceae bacterium]